MLAHLLLLGWDVQALLGWWEPGGPETLAPRAPLFFQLLHIEEAETAFFFFFPRKNNDKNVGFGKESK